MPINLAWVDLNVGPAAVDGFRIYRDDSPIDPAALPSPLITLARSIASFNDPDGLASDFYVIEAFKGSASRFAFVSASAPAPGFETTKLANPKGAWGTVLRVDGYEGPAIRVSDGVGGSEMDLYFDAEGFVTDAAPYSDTRVVKIYSQTGNSNHLKSEVGLARPGLYLPADANWNTARIDTSVFDKKGGYYDEVGGSSSHDYCVPNPIYCASLHYVFDGGFRGIGGVFGGVDLSDGFRFGAWIDNGVDSLRVSIEDGGTSSIGSDGYSDSDDHYKLVCDFETSPAGYYLNGETVGTKTWSPDISYTSTSRFVFGAVFNGDSDTMGQYGRQEFIEQFVLDHADAAVTDEIELQDIMDEARNSAP